VSLDADFDGVGIVAVARVEDERCVRRAVDPLLLPAVQADESVGVEAHACHLEVAIIGNVPPGRGPGAGTTKQPPEDPHHRHLGSVR
jgi:hypothetical protein